MIFHEPELQNLNPNAQTRNLRSVEIIEGLCAKLTQYASYTKVRPPFSHLIALRGPEVARNR